MPRARPRYEDGSERLQLEELYYPHGVPRRVQAVALAPYWFSLDNPDHDEPDAGCSLHLPAWLRCEARRAAGIGTLATEPLATYVRYAEQVIRLLPPQQYRDDRSVGWFLRSNGQDHEADVEDAHRTIEASVRRLRRLERRIADVNRQRSQLIKRQIRASEAISYLKRTAPPQWETAMVNEYLEFLMAESGERARVASTDAARLFNRALGNGSALAACEGCRAVFSVQRRCTPTRCQDCVREAG